MSVFALGLQAMQLEAFARNHARCNPDFAALASQKAAGYRLAQGNALMHQALLTGSASHAMAGYETRRNAGIALANANRGVVLFPGMPWWWMR